MRDKVYIVWRDERDVECSLEDEIVAVCASAKDAEEYLEDWAWARVESRVVASSEEMLAKRQEKEKELIKQRLYITDHKVLGREAGASAPV